jgi:MFS family permease
MLVGLLFLTWGMVFLDRMSQLYLAPYFAPEFHLASQQIGFLAAVVGVMWALSASVSGVLSDRFGRRVVLLPAIFAFSLLSWASGVVHSYHQLLIVRALLGIAEGPCWCVITALIEESSAPTRRARNVGLVVSSAALVGLAVAPVLTTQVAARVGWRWAFFVAGVPGLVLGIAATLIVKEPVRNLISETKIPGAPVKHSYVSILRYRNVWLCALGGVGFMTWLFLETVFAPLYITEVAHQSGTTAGFLLGATGLGSFFLGLLLPALSDRIGRKRALLAASALSVFVPLALLVPSLYAYPWVLAAIIFATNGGQCMPALLLVVVPTETVGPAFAATAIGLVTLGGEIIGATAAPAIGGILADRFGLAVPLWLSAAGALFVFLVSLFLNETFSIMTSKDEIAPRDCALTAKV